MINIDFLIQNKVSWITSFVTTILFITGITSYFFGVLPILSITTILINICFIIKFYKKPPVFIIFLFFLLYTITFKYYLIDHIDISYWTDFQDITSIKRVLLCHSIFIFCFGSFISGKISDNIFDYKKYFQPNKFIFSIFFIISVFILIFGLSGQSLLGGGSYADQEMINKSTMHEYFVLIFFFLIVYASNSKWNNICLKILIILYISKTLLFGSRVEVLEISLLWFYMFYIYKNRIKIHHLLLMSILGFYLINVVSNIRSNPVDFLRGDDLAFFFDPTTIFENKSNLEIISSNEGDVIQSSGRIIGLIDKQEITTTQRILSFLSYIVSPIIPSSLLPTYSNLSSFKQDYYRSGGGGLISTYFYTWLGYMGPVVIALILSFLINKLYSNNSVYAYVYGTMLFVTFPRWFAYNPIMLVKFCLYSVVIVFITKIILRENKIYKEPSNLLSKKILTPIRDTSN